jgi:chorismate lyase / 3-hydroxybenzoate synthase
MNSRSDPVHAAVSNHAPIDTPLHFRRLPLGEVATLAESLLGARLLAPSGAPLMPASGAAVQAVHAELLAPAAPTLDAWLTPGSVMAHQHGCVHIATDGHWLHGSAELDPAATEGGLAQVAWRIYTDLFSALARHGSSHLLRLWNYVPGINDHGDGLEHYRHFNVGRQRAFIDAGRSAFEGSPAACAVGTAGGPLQVFFLAGAVAPLAIENPRQVSAYHYPAQYGPRSPTFSRAAVADVGGGRQALFISGTASIQGHASVHLGDVRRQTEETLLNIAAVLEAAQPRLRATLPAEALSCTVYLRHCEDLATVLEVMQQRLGPHSHAVQTVVALQADICRADLLVEIEAHGVVPSMSDR